MNAVSENEKELIKKARIEKQQQNWIEVERIERQRLQGNPNDVRIMSDLAFALKQQGKYEELEGVIKSILEIEPKNVMANRDMLIIKKWQGKPLTEELEIRLQKLEEQCEIIKQAAEAKRQRNWVELEQLQSKMLSLDSNDERAMSDLAYSLRKQCKWEELKELQIKRLEINPQNKRAKINIKEAEKALAQKQQNTILKYRQEIKEGTIDVARANSIIEELKQTGGVRANILIAEIQARVMEMPQVSARFLQGCQKSATTEAEKKAYGRAIEIVKQKRTVALSQLEDIDER